MSVSVVVRYTLLQLPELALVLLALYLVVDVGWIGRDTALLCLFLWVLKDALLYPLYRHALREGPPVGTAALVGQSAVVITTLAPIGHVRVRGERWRARTQHGEELPSGAKVRIAAAEGLTLIVEPLHNERG